jgi:hypothetical protein
MTVAEAFDRSRFGVWINSPEGRIFRLTAGVAFLVLGLRFRHTVLGRAALVWSTLPLSAGGLDVCYISAALGGPVRGAEIRRRNASVRRSAS